VFGIVVEVGVIGEVQYDEVVDMLCECRYVVGYDLGVLG
jgi:hypothetical protein